MAKYGFAIMLMGVIVAFGVCFGIDWTWIVGLILGVIGLLIVLFSPVSDNGGEEK